MDTINTHNLKVDFGKHKGELYTRVPISYLRWMVNDNHGQKHIAQAELDRRGTTMPTLELSGHSIDRYSQKYLKVWQDARTGEEGLHSFMLRCARFAIDHGDEVKDNVYRVGIIDWVFQPGDVYPVLKTVK